MIIELPMYRVNIKAPEGVYAPAEDTFLLLETALKEIKAPAKVLGRGKTKNEKVLEVGTCPGLIACALAKQGFDVLAVDVDGKAIETTGKNAAANKLKIEARQSDLFESVKGKFDWVVFNPPYVPSGKGKLADRASEGGKKGREVIDRFLAELPKHLAEGGCALMLQSSLNGIGKTKAFAKKCGLIAEVVAKQKLFFEELLVVKLSLQNTLNIVF